MSSRSGSFAGILCGFSAGGARDRVRGRILAARSRRPCGGPEPTGCKKKYADARGPAPPPIPPGSERSGANCAGGCELPEGSDGPVFGKT